MLYRIDSVGAGVSGDHRVGADKALGELILLRSSRPKLHVEYLMCGSSVTRCQGHRTSGECSWNGRGVVMSYESSESTKPLQYHLRVLEFRIDCTMKITLVEHILSGRHGVPGLGRV